MRVGGCRRRHGYTPRSLPRGLVSGGSGWSKPRNRPRCSCARQRRGFVAVVKMRSVVLLRSAAEKKGAADFILAGRFASGEGNLKAIYCSNLRRNDILEKS